MASDGESSESTKQLEWPWKALDDMEFTGFKPGEYVVLYASPRHSMRFPRMSSIRAKAKNPTTKCECGEPLPVHLADLVDENFTHVCSCKKAWKVTSGLFVYVGEEDNPIADLDEVVEGTKCKRCGGGIDYIWVNLFHQITGKTEQMPSFCMDCTGAVLMKFEEDPRHV